MAYRNNFSMNNILSEREVSVCDLSDSIFMFMEEIFKKRKWGKLTKGALTLHVKVVREFYANYECFILDDHFITSTIRV